MTQNRVPCSGGTERCEPVDVAQHVHCVARHSKATAEQLAKNLRVGRDWFIKKTAGANPCDTPAWLMQALARETGRTDHIEALANETELLVCYRLDKSATRSDAQLADLLREFGESVSAFGDLLAKCRRSPELFEKARREWREVVNTGEALMARMAEEEAEARPRPQAVAR